jgi:uncharacterized protein (DUF2384 family)
MSQASLVSQLPASSQLRCFAEEVFGSQQQADTWLNKPHPLLDWATPIACANDEAGVERVRRILVAIKYGGVV